MFRSLRRGQRRPETSVDEYERLVKRVVLLEADVGKLEREWADAKLQIKRSYQRLERASQRAEERQRATSEDAPADAPASGESKVEKLLRLTRAARGA